MCRIFTLHYTNFFFLSQYLRHYSWKYRYIPFIYFYGADTRRIFSLHLRIVFLLYAPFTPLQPQEQVRNFPFIFTALIRGVFLLYTSLIFLPYNKTHHTHNEGLLYFYFIYVYVQFTNPSQNGTELNQVVSELKALYGRLVPISKAS